MTETDNDIFFYGKNELNGYMSNFYPCKFENEKGITFNCSEQYLMYMKAVLFEPDNNELHNNILKEENPQKIKAYGRKVKYFNNDIWNKNKENIMINGLRLKFNHNPVLKKKLLSTKIKELYEASPYDKIWGIGFSATKALNVPKEQFANNLLGKCLMKIRDEFNKKNIIKFRNEYD